MFSENLSSPDEKRRKSIRVASAQKSVTKGGIFSSQQYADKNNVSGDYYGVNYSDMKVSASYNPRAQYTEHQRQPRGKDRPSDFPDVYYSSKESKSKSKRKPRHQTADSYQRTRRPDHSPYIKHENSDTGDDEHE